MSGSKNLSCLKSILLIDDDSGFLELYAHILKEHLDAQIHTSRHPSAALRLAQNRLFDIVLIDVTMQFNGTPFGGLELYRLLLGRYGDSSLLAYSQFIDDTLLKQYDSNFNFIEGMGNPMHLVDSLASRITSLRLRQSCFVAMPFDARYDDIYLTIERCVQRSGYRCLRIDREAFAHSIIDKILTELRNAKLVVFVATDRNPNAFYECGYAVALCKEVITVTDSYSNLPFDVRDRNAVAYEGDLQKLDQRLTERLIGLTVAEPE